MASRKFKEEKKKPGPNFKLNFHLKFSISTTESIFSDFKELIKQDKDFDYSKLFRSYLFETLDIKNEDELVDLSPEIKILHKKMKDEILDLMELTNSGTSFSNWAENVMKDYISKNKKENEKKK